VTGTRPKKRQNDRLGDPAYEDVDSHRASLGAIWHCPKRMCFLLLVAHSGPTVLAQRRPPNVREMAYAIDQPIAERLSSTDEIVIIRRTLDTVMFNPGPSAKEAIYDAVSAADDQRQLKLPGDDN
jgi:hypothetical protein